MDSSILTYIIPALVGLVIGVLIGNLLLKKILKNKVEASEATASRIVKDAQVEAEAVKKNKILEAKEYRIKKQSEFDRKMSQRSKKLDSREQSLKSKDKTLSDKIKQAGKREAEADRIKKNLQNQLELVELKANNLDKAHGEIVKQLEKVSNLSAQEAKDQLVESLKEEARTKAMSHIKEIADEAKLKANKEAKKIIIQTIQRTAAEHAIENTVSVFNLPSDDVKGQIIGREGRNIRALEAATGVEIIVDDTPEAIIISGYDPVRREVCRVSLQRLVTDGRIHPARIEEIVKKTTKQINDKIMEIGERTVIELGIHGMHRELIRMVGRMRFRSSYGQNLLQHSKETAHLCATMAAELGINPKVAKRAGLLHDIGKVPDEESELSHALLGMRLCEKYGEHKAVCNAVGAHHDEVEMLYTISPIVQASDAISGARPGARRETLESYIQRLKDLEALALGYKGVHKAYAIQAGRELRVMVEADEVSDQKADELSFEMATKIQDEMQYPGQIKVTVIREKRAVNYAK